MAADASKGYQVAEVTLTQFRGELQGLAVERALARARHHRDHHPAAVEDFAARARDLVATMSPGVESASTSAGHRDLARKLRRMREVHRYLVVESSVWVTRARRQAQGSDGDIDLLLELCRQRDEHAREQGASSWLDLLLAVIGVPEAELDRVDAEMQAELGRGRFAEALAASEAARDEAGDATAGDPEETEETRWVPPRTMGEFLGRLGLGSFWERLVTEPAPGFSGAEALPVGGADDVRIFVGEQDGQVPARAFLGALGAALHDTHRRSATHGWCLPEVSVLRGAMARFFARYHDRAGWQVAYCNLDYDLALEREARSAIRAARKFWWRHGVARWVADLHRDPAGSAEQASSRLMRALGLSADEPAGSREAHLRAAVRSTLDRPAPCTWIETVVAENLFAELAAPPDATIDNPAVGRMLPDLLERPDHEPWDARLEVMRDTPLSGKLRPTLPGKHSS